MTKTEKARISPATMKALRMQARGGPEQLRYEDAPFPLMGAGDVIIKVYATGITPTELGWDETYQNQDGSKRIPSIVGHEVSGQIQSIGDGVSDLQVGQDVFGLTDFPRDGAAAEYVAVRGANLAEKPRRVDHAHAATLALSGLTAWQALFVHGNLTRGQRVLVHGGAGGVGTFAVQLAHQAGAWVATTASRDDTEFLRGLGADEVFDYRNDQFEEVTSNVDLVLDLIGGETQDRSWKTLRRGGTLINLSAPVPQEKATKYGVRGIFFIVEANQEHLRKLAELADSGELKTFVSRAIPLAEGSEAFERVKRHNAPGKTVLIVRNA